MKKKGQVPGNLLTIITVVIVVGVLLFLLAKGIGLFKKATVEDFSSFEIELQRVIDESAGSVDKSNKESLSFPDGVDFIYIFDQRADLSSLSYREKFLLEDAVKSGLSENVYLLSDNKIVHSFEVDKLSMLSPHYLCAENEGGRLELLVTGQDKGTQLITANAESSCTVPTTVRDVVMHLNNTLSGDKFQEAMDFYVSAISRSGNIEIKYDITYDPYTDKTKVVMRVMTDVDVDDFTYFEYIPKCLMQAAGVTDFIHTNDADTDILKDDPLMMWDFGGVEDGQETEFEVDHKVTDFCAEMLAGFGVGYQTTPFAGAVVGLPDGLISTGLIQGATPYLDYDGDGVTNGNDDFPDDVDNDGFPTDWEQKHGYGDDDPTSPGLGDDDSDGLPNDREYDFGTNPVNPDTDGDGVIDGDEVNYHTNPLDSDTDADTLPDSWEIKYMDDAVYISPLEPYEAGQDSDGDGLFDIEEYTYETDPTDTDSDGDGIYDGAEVFDYDPPIDPNNPDSDGDGISDGVDWNPSDGTEIIDTDGNGIGDNLDPDDDGDGIPDEDDDDPLNGNVPGSHEPGCCDDCSCETPTGCRDYCGLCQWNNDVPTCEAIQIVPPGELFNRCMPCNQFLNEINRCHECSQVCKIDSENTCILRDDVPTCFLKQGCSGCSGDECPDELCPLGCCGDGKYFSSSGECENCPENCNSIFFSSPACSAVCGCTVDEEKSNCIEIQDETTGCNPPGCEFGETYCENGVCTSCSDVSCPANVASENECRPSNCCSYTDLPHSCSLRSQ